MEDWVESIQGVRWRKEMRSVSLMNVNSGRSEKKAGVKGGMKVCQVSNERSAVERKVRWVYRSVRNGVV